MAGPTHGKGGVGSGYFIGMDHEEKVSTVFQNMKRRTLTTSPVSLHDNVQSSSSVDHTYDHVQSKIDSQGFTPFRVCGDNNDDDEPAHLHMYEQYAMTAQPVSKLPPARRLCPSDEEF